MRYWQVPPMDKIGLGIGLIQPASPKAVATSSMAFDLEHIIIVIGAPVINQHFPYDEFVRLQLAGDVLAPDDIQAASATGFLGAGPLSRADHGGRWLKAFATINSTTCS